MVSMPAAKEWTESWRKRASLLDQHASDAVIPTPSFRQRFHDFLDPESYSWKADGGSLGLNKQSFTTFSAHNFETSASLVYVRDSTCS